MSKQVARLSAEAHSIFQFWMHPKHWANKSDDLWRSAKLVWSQYGQQSRDAETPNEYWELHGAACIALMLVGLGIENAAKGMLIAHKIVGSDSRNYSQIANYFDYLVRKKHRLSDLWNELADVAGYRNDSQYKDRLDRISEYVVWYARYPLPTKITKFDDFRKRAYGGKLYEVEILLDWSSQTILFLQLELDKIIRTLPPIDQGNEFAHY